MNRARGGQSRDLLLVAAASLVSLALLAIPIDGLIKALLLIPMVLVLPGYAISRALFPFGRPPGDERLVYTFTLSVGAAALGGLAWQLAFDLNRLTWASLLTAITLIGCAIAQWRRNAHKKARRARRQPDKAESRLPRLDLPTGVALLAAIAIAIFAVSVAVDGLREQRAESRFSSLWIAPEGTAGGVEIGVWNHQGAVHVYRLTVEASGATIEDWRGRLGAHQNKQLSLAPPAFSAGERLVVSLYRDGALYRRTELEGEAGT
jgi:uncharacterized membrane protein